MVREQRNAEERQRLAGAGIDVPNVNICYVMLVFVPHRVRQRPKPRQTCRRLRRYQKGLASAYVVRNHSIYQRRILLLLLLYT